MRTDQQLVATGGNGFGLFFAVLGAWSFATSCHRLRRLGSVDAPFRVAEFV
jgi:hypothetical protein